MGSNHWILNGFLHELDSVGQDSVDDDLLDFVNIVRCILIVSITFSICIPYYVLFLCDIQVCDL